MVMVAVGVAFIMRAVVGGHLVSQSDFDSCDEMYGLIALAIVGT